MAGFQGLQGYHLLLSSSYHLYLLVSVYSSVVIPSKVRVTRVFYSNRIRVLVVVSQLFVAGGCCCCSAVGFWVGLLLNFRGKLFLSMAQELGVRGSELGVGEMMRNDA